MQVTPGETAARGPRYWRWQNHWRDVIVALQEIGNVVAAHTPLAGGLLALSEDAPGSALGRVFRSLHRDVSNGTPLHEAMAKLSDFFPAHCVARVRAGEDSGKLAEALDEVRRDMTDALSFGHRAQGHGAYLIAILLAESFCISGLLIWVAPQLATIFHAFGAPTNRMLDFVLAAQRLYVPQIVFVLALLIPVLWIRAQHSRLQNGPLARRLDGIAMAIPFVRGARIKRNLATGSAILSKLLGAGMPLHTALRCAGDTDLDPACGAVFQRMAGRIENGNSIAEAMAPEQRILPRSFRALVGLGEAGGQVPEALAQLAALYREQSLRFGRLALEIGAPLFLCLIALMVFCVYSGVFIAIFQLSSVVRIGP